MIVIFLKLILNSFDHRLCLCYAIHILQTLLSICQHIEIEIVAWDKAFHLHLVLVKKPF